VHSTAGCSGSVYALKVGCELVEPDTNGFTVRKNVFNCRDLGAGRSAATLALPYCNPDIDSAIDLRCHLDNLLAYVDNTLA
jgi:hypothetical protein